MGIQKGFAKVSGTKHDTNTKNKVTRRICKNLGPESSAERASVLAEMLDEARRVVKEGVAF